MNLFESQKTLDEGNRRITRRVFIGFIGAGVIGGIGKYFYDGLDKPPGGFKSSFVTPTDNFYSVAFNGYPDIPAESWRLTFRGPENRAFTIDLATLKTLPNSLIFKTFECIENPVGGEAIGNAQWRVTPLSPLLEKVLPTDRTGLNAFFSAYDGYRTSLPLGDVLDRESYLAYEMNGAPLRVKYGFPARLLLPGKYGYKQPKWIAEIRVANEPLSGYWEEKGWSKSGEVKAMSRIDTAAREGAPGDAIVTGVAYAGREAVGTVEISLDRGTTWLPAELSSEAGPNHWTLWRYVWRNAPTGRHKLIVRVTDAKGHLQIEKKARDYPAGTSGWHRVDVVL